MPSHHPTRTRAGFTLMEVLLAVAILSIVIAGVYNIWNTSLNAWRRGTDASEVFQRQRIVMEALGELAQSVVFFSSNPTLYSIVAAKNPGLGDSVSFVTASDAFLPPSEATAAGMRRVTISLEQNDYRRTYLAIVNQPALKPADDSKDKGTLQAHVISTDVSGFYVRYRNPRDGTWADTWEDANTPPSAMEFTVVFGQQGDRLAPVVVTRAVDIPVAAFLAEGGLAAIPGLTSSGNAATQVPLRNVGTPTQSGSSGGYQRGQSPASGRGMR